MTFVLIYKYCLWQGEELQLVREALRSLRDSFSGHDPQHHTLDTLEQGVSSLMDRLHSLDSQRRQDRGVRTYAHTHAHTASTKQQHICHLMNDESTKNDVWLLTVSNWFFFQEEFKSPGRRANSTDRDSWPQSSSETNKILVFFRICHPLQQLISGCWIKLCCSITLCSVERTLLTVTL